MGGYNSKEVSHTNSVKNNIDIIIQNDGRIIILLWIMVIISICEFGLKVYFYLMNMDVKKKAQNNSMA